jgi:hypothetical protein
MVNPQPEVSITRATYTTNYQLDTDGDGNVESVICDDRITELSYNFDYVGKLHRWSSFLEGVLTGQVRGETTFYPGAPQVDYSPESVEVTYKILPTAAPLVKADTADIAITPTPSVIGYTQLKVRVNGHYTSIRLTSQEIPVVATC